VYRGISDANIIIALSPRGKVPRQKTTAAKVIKKFTAFCKNPEIQLRVQKIHYPKHECSKYTHMLLR